MMNIEYIIESAVKRIVKNEYNFELSTIELTATRKEFDGDVTVVIFSMLRD
jgi:arginyl-tRNA synthetase